MDYKYPLYNSVEVKTLAELLDRAVENGKDKPAFLEKASGQASFQGPNFIKVRELTQAFSTALVSHKITASDKIAVIGENRTSWAITYLAVTSAGAVIVPIDKESKDQELFHVLYQSKAKAVVYSGKYSETIQELRSKLPALKFCINMDTNEHTSEEYSFDQLVDDGNMSIQKQGKPMLFRDFIEPDDLAALLFTSGTTAIPKIVGLSHKNITSNIKAMLQLVEVTREDTFLSVLPMHHVYECTCGFLCPFAQGATVAFAQNLRKVADNMAEVKASIMLGVPALFKALYNRLQAGLNEKATTRIYYSIGKALGSLSNNKLNRSFFGPVQKKFGGNIKFFVSGGAAIDPEISKGLGKLGFTIIQGYGLTECSPILAVNRPKWFKDASVGFSMPSCEVKIHEPDDMGIGEIYARGDSVITHYYENPELDKTAFEDGWFKTGDMGRIDEDHHVYVMGRTKNVIVTEGGKNVYPEELEEQLNRSTFILESVVTTKSDDSKNEQIHAIIVPDFESFDTYCASKSIPNNEEELNKLLKAEVKTVSDSLADFKRIRGFTIRSEEFTKTSTRKIKRHKIY